MSLANEYFSVEVIDNQLKIEILKTDLDILSKIIGNTFFLIVAEKNNKQSKIDTTPI